MVLSVDPAQVAAVQAAAEAAGIAMLQIGTVGGDRMVVEGLLDVALLDATEAWRSKLPDALGAGVTQG